MTTNDSRRGSAHHRRTGGRFILIRPMAILAGLVLALQIAGPVTADAVLVTSSPENEAVVTTPPTDVTLTFDEGLDPAKSSFKVARDGATIGTGKVSTARAEVMTLDGLDLAPGGYEVRWTAGSTDGHIVRGTLTFTVADPTPAPPTPEASTATPTEAPAVTPAVTATTPTAGMSAPGELTPAATTSDALVPIAVGLVAVATIGVLVLRRSRRA